MVRIVVLAVIASVSAFGSGHTFPTGQVTGRDQPGIKTILWSGANIGDVQSISPDGKAARLH